MEQALRLEPTNTAEPVTIDKLRLSAFTLIKYGAHAEAMEVLEQVLEMDPENYEATIMAQVISDPDELEHAEAIAVAFVPDAHDDEL